MHYVNPTENGNHVNVRECVCHFRMQNELLHVAIGVNANRMVESIFFLFFTARVVKFWIQPSDSSDQAGFPEQIGQKVRGVSETYAVP